MRELTVVAARASARRAGMRGTEGRQVLEALSVFCCFLCGKRMPAGGYTRKDMQGARRLLRLLRDRGPAEAWRLVDGGC